MSRSFADYENEVRRTAILAGGSKEGAYGWLVKEVAFSRMMADIDREHDDRVYREALADMEGKLARRESVAFKGETVHE